MKDGFYGIQGALAENRFAQQNCCCEIKSGIKDLSAEGYRNACEITTAIHAEGEATRALINSNTMQELRDKLAEKDREVQARDFQLSQIAQTNNIVGQIRPCPVPAYVTCNPRALLLSSFLFPIYNFNFFVTSLTYIFPNSNSIRFIFSNTYIKPFFYELAH